MTETLSFLLPFSLSLLLNALLSTAATGIYTAQVLPLNKFQWNHRNLIVPPSFPPQSRSVRGATILEMKHRAYSSPPIRNWNQFLQNRLISDETRVRSLQFRFRKRVSAGEVQGLFQTQIPLTSGVKVETLNYIVTIQLGGKNTTVIVDTGSDLTWVQCKPCKLCYNQQEPLFDPSTSSSYQPIQCNSTTCRSLLFATGNSGVCGTSPSTCNYAASYGDGSYTRGDLANDQLVLGPTIAVNSFVFGCGRNNKGLFGGASGLMGLGRSSLSLVSQTSRVFGGLFSYCLPSTEFEFKASGSLAFGGDSLIYQNSTPISYTKLIPNPMLSTFYFVNLTGTSIGGVMLNSSSFGRGILIDSGTVISRFPPSIYNNIKAEFVKQFSGFPPAPAFSILDICFNLWGYEEVSIPTIRMYFEGNAELAVDVTGVLYFVKTDASQVCLALASLSSENEIGIIGNYQQRNTRVVYDTKEDKLGFARETCNFS